MVTLCVSIADNRKDCLPYLLKSLKNNSSTISEILIADVNILGHSQNNETTTYGIPTTQFIVNVDHILKLPHLENKHFIVHPLALHACIDRAKNDHLLFADHDIIFITDVGKIFTDLIEKYTISIIGIELTIPHQISCYLNFPSVSAAMVRKSTLPPPTFLQDKLQYKPYLTTNKQLTANKYPQAPGKYLIQSPIIEIADSFPNPDGLFDVGCNLWYWYKDKKWLTLKKENDGPTFHTNQHYNNFELPSPKHKQPILFHKGGAYRKNDILEEVSNYSGVGLPGEFKERKPFDI